MASAGFILVGHGPTKIRALAPKREGPGVGEGLTLGEAGRFFHEGTTRPRQGRSEDIGGADTLAAPGAGAGLGGRQGPGQALSYGGRAQEGHGRGADSSSPFLSLFPGEIRASENSYFCQAARQLASVPSSQLCVKLASGGDPTYAFNIRFTGEEVHGTSRWHPQQALLHPIQGGGCVE